MPGFAGFFCERAINVCINSPCVNGGVCLEVAHNVFNCSCPNGYSGRFCERKVNAILGLGLGFESMVKQHRLPMFENPCTSRPCLNDGICLLKTEGFSCVCGLQYTGMNCQYMMNFCATNPCLNGGTCVNNMYGYTCVCNKYFTGNSSNCKEISFEQ